MNHTTEELLTHLRRVEQTNDTLRRRNGELFAELQKHDLHVPLTPISDYPSRYQLLDRIVTIAVELALAPAVESDTLLGQLEEAVDQHQNYWQHVQAERDKRAAAGEKARATKAEKRLARGA